MGNDRMNEKPDPIPGSDANPPNSAVKSHVTPCRLVLAATAALALVVVCYFALKALDAANRRLMGRAPGATTEQQKMCGAIWKKTNITPTGNVAAAPKFPPFRPPFDPGIVIVFSAALLDDERCAAEK